MNYQIDRINIDISDLLSCIENLEIILKGIYLFLAGISLLCAFRTAEQFCRDIMKGKKQFLPLYIIAALGVAFIIAAIQTSSQW